MIEFQEFPKIATEKECMACGNTFNLSNFSPRAKGRLGVNSRCKQCCSKETTERYHRDPEKYRAMAVSYRKSNLTQSRAVLKKYRDEHPERRLLDGCRYRAKRKNISCSITMEDIVIPAVCPVLGIKIEYSKGRVSDSSPSVDRIDARRGYVKGNIHVISHKANRLKSHFTIQEVEKLWRYMSNAM